MEIIDAKCPNCGSEIKINKEEKTGTCAHCNSQFLIEDAIKNYITNNYIEHATIIKNDFGDDVVYNEVDKYLALYELDDLNRMAPSILKLKEQFPHKGLARIVILHYQFQLLLNRVDEVDEYFNEVEEIKKRVKSYHPKSYKDEPPYSKFLWAMNQVEIKYAEDIETLLTQQEKEKYQKLIEETLLCVEAYNSIYASNKELEEKYAPFKEKQLKKQKKLEKKALKHSKDDIIDNNDTYPSSKVSALKTKLVSIITCILLLVLGTIALLGNYYIFSKPTISASQKNINLTKIATPSFNGPTNGQIISTNNVNVSCVREYTIRGRVTGIKKFLPFGLENKTISAIIFFTWGDYSTEQSAKTLGCKYSEQDKNFVCSTFNGAIYNLKQHSSTNYIIPEFSNSVVKRCVRSIRKNDVIEISGYLANVSILDKNNVSSYQTSNSLLDDKYEIIYVTNINWITE